VGTGAEAVGAILVSSTIASSRTILVNIILFRMISICDITARMNVTHEAGSCSKVPAVLREGLGWPVARIAHAFTAAHNEALAPFGLNLRTFAVLATVAGGSLRSQLEIAQSLGLDKTTLVVTIDDLERRALVLRKPEPDDRRARILEITAPGVELFAQASEAVRATERNLLAGMSDERIEQTQTALLALLSGPLREYFDRAGSCL
jgi:DNA-binding MarR family transcriptional regulator